MVGRLCNFYCEGKIFIKNEKNGYQLLKGRGIIPDFKRFKYIMWFPPELWRIIKNYLLGKEYWRRKLLLILNTIPSPRPLACAVYSSALASTRFQKTFERSPFFKHPAQVTVKIEMVNSMKEIINGD